MKRTYTFIILLLIAFTGFAQNYEFGIVQNTAFNFSVVAIPNIASTVTTDVSDIGFTLLLPAGTADVINGTPFNGRTWTTNEVTAAQLTGLDLGDGARDAFVMNLSPNATPIVHTAGQQFVLISFDVSNAPSSGLLEILSNTDPIAVGLGGAADSFYNVNLDGPGGAAGTTNQFTGLASGIENFSFDTLAIETQLLDDLEFTVYPNPTQDYFSVKGATSKIELLEIFTINGQKVMALKAGFENVNINRLNAAIYFIKVSTHTSQKVVRLIKK
jgi:hypothetical protein